MGQGFHRESLQPISVRKTGRNESDGRGAGIMWNYRAIKEVCEDETIYRVYEVYYDKNGQIEGWTAKPTYPQGETLDELRSSLIMMLRDVDQQPELDMEELRKRFPEPAAQGGAR